MRIAWDRMPRPIRLWLIHGGLSLLLASPLFVLAFDHHGAERLPQHQHASDALVGHAPHAHDFETIHIHGSVFQPTIQGSILVVTESAALEVTWPLNHLNSLLPSPRALEPAPSRALDLRLLSLTHQHLASPPTRPPSTVALIPSSQSHLG